MERTPTGVLTLRFHTDNGPITFTGTTHRDLPKAMADIGDDRANKVLVVTGTRESFIDAIDGDSLGEISKPTEWDKSQMSGHSAREQGFRGLIIVGAPDSSSRTPGPVKSRRRKCRAERVTFIFEIVVHHPDPQPEHRCPEV